MEIKKKPTVSLRWRYGRWSESITKFPIRTMANVEGYEESIVSSSYQQLEKDIQLKKVVWMRKNQDRWHLHKSKLLNVTNWPRKLEHQLRIGFDP